MTRRTVLLSALASMPADVRRAVRGLNQATRPAPPGKVSAVDILKVLKHLVEAEVHYYDQLRRAVKEDLETWSVLSCELASPAVATDGGSDEGQIESLVKRFEAARGETLAFLEALAAGDWQRKVVHETRGEMTLRFLVQGLVDHDTQHLGQLAGLHGGAVAAGFSAAQLDSLQNRQSRQDSEVKNERKRTRKWPRGRTRRGY